MIQYTFKHHPNPISILIKILKYLLEGVAISIAAFVLNRKNISLNTAIGIACTAALILAVLDHFTNGKLSRAVRFGVVWNWDGIWCKSTKWTYFYYTILILYF